MKKWGVEVGSVLVTIYDAELASFDVVAHGIFPYSVGWNRNWENNRGM